jgi:hypothetical protein
LCYVVLQYKKRGITHRRHESKHNHAFVDNHGPVTQCWCMHTAYAGALMHCIVLRMTVLIYAGDDLGPFTHSTAQQ